MENLMDGLISEMNRARELQKMYEEIGPNGMFGLAVIKGTIVAAENSIKSNDVVQMVEAYQMLKDLQ